LGNAVNLFRQKIGQRVSFPLLSLHAVNAHYAA
jgi:hypothetical protein